MVMEEPEAEGVGAIEEAEPVEEARNNCCIRSSTIAQDPFVEAQNYHLQ